MQINKSDKDFLDYFGTITHLFAIVVTYARKFRDILTEPFLLTKFIEGRGLAATNNDSVVDSSYILANIIDEYRKRGTERILSKDGVDGELTRIINHTEPEEFIFALSKIENFGWCLGESSPSWYQTQGFINLIKGYEFSEGVEDLTKYPLTSTGNIAIEFDTEKEVDCFLISSYAGVESGIKDTGDENYWIKVNPSIDYEISFWVKVASGNGENIRFDVSSYDRNGNTVSLRSINNGALSNSFSGSGSKNMVSGKWYWMRGVLHKKDTPLMYQNNLNFKGGKGILMDNDTRFIVPNIYLDGLTSSQNTLITDVKIRPLNLPMSQGILGIKNIIIAYLKNKGSYTNEGLEELIKTKLIPYNSELKIKYLE